MDLVEDVFHTTSGFENRDQSETPTLLLYLRNLVGDPAKFEYTIQDLADVVTVAAQLQRDLVEIVLPYFESHSNFAEIDAALNEDPEGGCGHYPSNYLRCAYGLIVAQKARRSNYAELVKFIVER